MKTLLKGLGISAVGLAVVFGSALTLAKPKKPHSMGCTCQCWWKDANGKDHLGNNTFSFTTSMDNPKGCGVAAGIRETCKDLKGTEHAGRMDGCTWDGKYYYLEGFEVPDDDKPEEAHSSP